MHEPCLMALLNTLEAYAFSLACGFPGTDSKRFPGVLLLLRKTTTSLAVGRAIFWFMAF